MPRLFHSLNCQGTIREYGLYKYRDVKDGRPVSELPIDINNDALKAIAYGLVYDYGYAKRKTRKRIWSSPFSDWTDDYDREVAQAHLPPELRSL